MQIIWKLANEFDLFCKKKLEELIFFEEEEKLCAGID